MAEFTNKSKNSANFNNKIKTGIDQTIGDIKNYTIAELKKNKINAFKEITYNNKAKNSTNFNNKVKN